MSEYGILTNIVSIATSLVAAAGAIKLLITKGTKWQPFQENLGKSSSRMGSFITSIGIGLIWCVFREDKQALVSLTIWAAAIAFVSLLVYGYLIGMQSYTKSKDDKIKIIGGFKLTKDAKTNMERAKTERVKRSITIEDYYRGVQCKEDRVWTRASLNLAKQLFVLGYVCFVSSAAISLASVAMRMSLEINK